MLQRRSVLKALLVPFFLALPSMGTAQPILTVTTPERSATYTLNELIELPQTTVVTKNDYVDGATAFQGPRLRVILEQLSVDQSAELKLTALNDFTSQVPASDAFDYDVILAILRDGETMPVREKGPIWVIYPMDDHPELQDEAYNGRMVWQLKDISVE